MAIVIRLLGRRKNVARTMSDAELDVMRRHAIHWSPFIESGQMVVFGPILDEDDSWGLGVIDTDDEERVRDLAAADPAVLAGIGTIEIGTMPGGYLRPQ